MGNAPSEDGSYGWRVLKVFANSPCTSANLVPYFDVLTHVNGIPLTKAESSLMEMIKDGVATKLTVLNYVSKKAREVTVVPNKSWGGDGLLGLMIRFDDYTNADEDTIHILDVHPGSPAEKAGLQPYSDYLLGTAKLSFKGYDQLDYFLEKFQGKEAQVFVFNAKTNRVREVTITPNSSWGGKGSLGCDVGTGYLHRLPVSAEKEVTIDGSQLLSPSQLPPQMPSSFAPPTPIVLQPAPLPVAQPVDTSAHSHAPAHPSPAAAHSEVPSVAVSPAPAAAPGPAPVVVSPTPVPLSSPAARPFVAFGSPSSAAPAPSSSLAMPQPLSARPPIYGAGSAGLPIAHTPSPPPAAVAIPSSLAPSPVPVTAGFTSGSYSYAAPLGATSSAPSAVRPPLSTVGVGSGFLGAASQVAPASTYVPGQFAAAAAAQAALTPQRIGATTGMPSASPPPGLGAAYGVRAPYTPGSLGGLPSSGYVPGSALSALSALSSPARPPVGVAGAGLAPLGGAGLPLSRPPGTS